MCVSSYNQFFVFLDDIHGLESIQLFYDTREAVFMLPYKMETKLASRIILKLHLYPVGFSNGCKHGVEWYIVENVWLNGDCVGFNRFCGQGSDWFDVGRLLRCGLLRLGSVDVAHDLDGCKGNARSQEDTNEGCRYLLK